MASIEELPVMRDKLYTLESVLNQDKMRPIFKELAQKHLGNSSDINRIDMEVIRRRNQRCVIRYILEVKDELNGKKNRHETWRIIGKVFKANRGERVFSDMKLLWANGFSRNSKDGISMPEPHQFLPSLCLLFQEEVPGLPLKEYVNKSPKTEHFRVLARTLAKLHQCPIAPTRLFQVRDHLLRCHPKHGFLALAYPDLADSINYITNTAYKLEKKMGSFELAPLHGDFHLGQVHIKENRSWLIDFDGLCYGDPASDLGNILVFLKAKARRNPSLSNYVETFLDEYFSIMDQRISERVPLYEGLTHLRRACKCLRLQEEGWQRRARRMVEQGVASIDLMAQRWL